MSNNNKLVEATAEFLSRNTSSSFLNEARETLYKGYTNSKGKKVNAVIDPGHFKMRMTYHKQDIRTHSPGGINHSQGYQGGYSTPEESKKHMDLAKEAYHAHTNAMEVHKSPTSTPKQKEDATRHAEHASIRYYKQEPKTLHDLRSQQREDNYHSYANNYGEDHPDAHLVK